MTSQHPARRPSNGAGSAADNAAGLGGAELPAPEVGATRPDGRLVAASILVIDDDPLDGTWVQAVLASAAHSVEVVVDPHRGYERARSGAFDLVMLDALMPDIDGVELCARLHRDAAGTAVPVLFLTSDASPELHVRALEAGAVDLLVKPAHPEVLLARVDTHLRAVRRHRSAWRENADTARELGAVDQQLERHEAELARLMDAVPMPFAACSRSGELELVNQRFCSLLGMTPAQLEGRGVGQLPPARLGHALAGLLDDALDTGVVATGEVTLELPRRSQRILELRVEPLGGASAAAVITISDMTLLLDELRQLGEAASDLSQAQRIGGLGSWTYEVATGRVRWSDQTYRLLGLPRGETPTVERFAELLHPEDRDAALAAWDEAFTQGEFDVEHRVVTPNGVRWLRSVGEFQYDQDGQLQRVDGTFLDVTASRRRNDHLAEERARFGGVLDALGAVALEWDPDVPGLRVLRGDQPVDLAAVADQRLSLRAALALVHPRDRRAVLAAWRHIVVDGAGEVERVCRLRGAGAAWRTWRLFLRAPASRRTRSVVVAAVEVAQATVEGGTAGAQGVDPLTGLPDRSGFLAQLAHLCRTARAAGDAVVVACVDLDGFAGVNVRFGRHIGDDVLERIAHRLRVLPTGPAAIARLEADQFAVALRCNADRCDTEQLVAGLRAAVAVVPAPEVSVAMTASIGIARSDPGTGRPGTAQPSPGRLLRRAEQARTAAKRRGLNQTRWFDSGEEAAIVRRSRRDLELEEAWEQRQFRLWFQPQVCADSGRLTGFEALLRWQHPTRGLLAPAAFIADLEASALARPVGWWVLSEALTQLEAWQAAGWDLTVSVNLGAQLVNDAELAAGVAQALARHPQLRPDRLELELLETATIDDVAGLAAQVAQLQAGGVRVALDDFGVGGSSLSLLHRLGVDTVKVDRSFVLRLPDDPDLEAMVRTIVALAQRFDAEVVAEGVETDEHRALIHALGCHRAQGYAIARPMPAEEVLGWVAARQVRGS